MLKLRKANLREPSEEVTAKQAVTEAHRTISPVDAAQRATARRAVETRWAWYVQLVVNKRAGTE